jgi:hypothetical protein
LNLYLLFIVIRFKLCLWCVLEWACQNIWCAPKLFVSNSEVLYFVFFGPYSWYNLLIFIYLFFYSQSDVDECRNMPFLCRNGRCRNSIGSFVCECADGYTLSNDGQYCRDIDECQEVCKTDIIMYNHAF